MTQADRIKKAVGEFGASATYAEEVRREDLLSPWEASDQTSQIAFASRDVVIVSQLLYQHRHNALLCACGRERVPPQSDEKTKREPTPHDRVRSNSATDRRSSNCRRRD